MDVMGGLNDRRPQMLKASIVLSVLSVLCVGAGGAALWATSAAPSKPQPIPAVTMPSLEELHARAHLQTLPVQEVKEPF
jgi:hypothetical protein